MKAISPLLFDTPEISPKYSSESVLMPGTKETPASSQASAMGSKALEASFWAAAATMPIQTASGTDDWKAGSLFETN